MANTTHDVVAIHLPSVWVHGAGLSGKERKNEFWDIVDFVE